MRSKRDYIDGLSGMKRNIYFDGRLIDRTDELQQHCLDTIGLTYDQAQKPENENPMTATSHLTGERISRFTHIHQNTDDLHKKQDMTRMLCNKAVWHEAEILCDPAGGVVATFPHEKDFLNPETKDLLLKYTKRSPKMSAEDQAQFRRFPGDNLCSATGGINKVGGYHGGGSPIRSRSPSPVSTISNRAKSWCATLPA